MYQSKYYTCEEIDERLLKGYYDDAVSNGYSGTFEQFKLELASQDIVNLDILNSHAGYTSAEAISKISELYPTLSHTLTFIFFDKTYSRERRFKYKGSGDSSERGSFVDNSNYVFTIGELNGDDGAINIKPLLIDIIYGFTGTAYITGSSGLYGGKLILFTDDMAHVVHQILFTSFLISDDGTKITNTHVDEKTFIYERFLNFASSSEGVPPKGTWSRWEARENFITEKLSELDLNIGDLAQEITDNIAVLNEEGETQKTPFSFMLNQEYILAIIDSEKHLLFGIRYDGSTEFAAGVPKPIREFVESKIASIDFSNLQTKLTDDQLSAISDVENKVTKVEGKGLSSNDFTNALKEKLEGINLSLYATKEALGEKQPKEDGKGLIDAIFSSLVSFEESQEFIELHKDTDGKILYGVSKDGNFFFGKTPNEFKKVFNYADEKLKEAKVYADNLISNKATFEQTRFTDLLNRVKSASVSIPPIIRPSGESFVINVTTQSQFDALESSIKSALANGNKNIVVSIESGNYYYNERHIDLSNLNYPDASVTICGCDAKIIAKGEMYSSSSPNAVIDGQYVKVPYIGQFDIAYMYSDKNRDTIEHLLFRDFKNTKELIDVISVDEDNIALCKIDDCGYPDKPQSECSDLYLQITRWYLSDYCKVQKIEDGSLYFYFAGIGNGYGGSGGYNVNNDYYFGSQMPRYRLQNYRDGENLAVENGYIYIPKRLGEVYESKVGKFAILNSTKLRTFDVDGITFVNATKTSVISAADGSSFESFVVENNKFFGIRGGLMVYACNNLHFCNNYICRMFGNGVDIVDKSTNCELFGNRFEKCGLDASNRWCVKSATDHYLIYDNEFIDYGYSAIESGVWHGTTQVGKSIGIIEKNVIRYTDEWFNNPHKYCIMDSGAIYLFTKNDDVIIRYNFIYNYNGMKNNIGIFYDDGCKNVHCFGNVILNIENAYSMESRLVGSIADLVPDHNTNNTFLYNIYDRNCKMEGKDDNSCVKGRNIAIKHTHFEFPDNVTNKCQSEDDCVISGAMVEDCKIFLPAYIQPTIFGLLDKFITSKIHKLY